VKPFSTNIGNGKNPDVMIILYNNRVMNEIFGAIASLSVVGIYVGVIFVVGNFIRLVFDRYSEKSIYEDLPETEKLREIIEGIYIAQLRGEIEKEKKLYNLLVLIYRSPELMLALTGYKIKHKVAKRERPAVQNGADNNSNN
jgi:hypothetical protein